ncbi:VanW family protein [Candidatus Woesebacteria bacterium]|nr:VanW family protein [Candidatus Woesebacteria bacterium]
METHILHIPKEHQKWWSSLQNWRKHSKGIAILAVLGTFLAATLLAVAWIWTPYNDRIVSHVSVAGTPVGDLTREAATQIITTEHPVRDSVLTIATDEDTYSTSSAWLEVTRHYDEAVNAAFAIGHTGPWHHQLRERWQSKLGTLHEVALEYAYNQEKLHTWLAAVESATFVAGEHPSAHWSGGAYNIDSGTYGQVLNREATQEKIVEALGKDATISADITVTHTPLSADGRITTEKRLDVLSDISITVTVSEDEPVVTITPAEFIPWLQLPEGFWTATMSSELADLTAHWNQEPQNAIFEQNDSGAITTFQPDEPGRQVDAEHLTNQVQEIMLSAGQSVYTQAEVETDPTIQVAVSTTPAEVQLKDTNDLGINELLGQGVSTFYHSIPNRVFNVELTSERLHATLVRPGEDFSFNQSVGEVSGRTGYKSAYVIQNGRTVLGDGGGVCQVSTTTFRAALDAGFPISRWKAHSYRVGYYEQNQPPGYDATVYAPSVDFRFTNDTEHAIVLSTEIDVPNRHLVVKIWGTSDGRTSEISDYRQWNHARHQRHSIKMIPRCRAEQSNR